LLDGASPLFALDAANDRYALSGRAATLSEIIAVSNPSTVRTYVDASGVLQTAPANVPRIDWTSGAPELLLEGPTTNAVRNSIGAGAAVGAPGTMPTYWTKSGGSGLSTEVVAVGTSNGMPFVRIRVSGTTTAAAQAHSMIPDALGTLAAAAIGQTWTSSIFIRLISGSFPVNYPALIITENNSSGAYLGNGGSALQLSSTWQRASTTRTLSIAGVAYVITSIYAQWAASGTAVDVTYDVALPQLEMATAPTSPVVTNGSAVTRTADVVTLSSLAGAVSALAIMASATATVAEQTIVGGPSAGRVLSLRSGAPAHALLDGSTMLATETPAANDNLRLAVGWGASGRGAAARGAAARLSSAAMAVDRSTLYLGASGGLAAGQALRIRRLVGWSLADRPSATGLQFQSLGFTASTLSPITSRSSTRDFQYTSATTNRHDCRIRHPIAVAAPQGIRFRYVGWQFTAGSAGDKAMTATQRQIDEVFVEYPVGVMTQVKFGGAKSITLNPWDDVWSDPVPIAPAKGDVIFEQISYRQTGSAAFDCPLTVFAGLGEYSAFRAFATYGSAASFPTGSANALPLATTGQAWGAAAIYGVTGTPGVLLAGTSIDDGAGGDQTAGSNIANPGWIARALNDAFGIVRMTAPSSTLVAAYSALNCMSLSNGNVKYGIIGHEINDAFGGATLATIQARYASVAANMRASGCKYVFAVTMLPATDSTDGWTSYANQTVRASESVRLAQNAWLLGSPAFLDGVVDMSAALNPSYPDKWPVDIAASGDGTHPTTAMNNRAAAICGPQLLALIAAKEAADASIGGTKALPRARYPRPVKKTVQVGFSTTAFASHLPWDQWSATAAGSALALTDQSLAVASGWTMTLGATALSAIFAGGYSTTGNASALVPDAIMAGGARMAATAIVFTISGLNPAKSYNLSLLCSQSVAGYNTTLTVTGAVAQAARTVTALANVTPELYAAIAPDAGGNIAISVVRATGATYGALCAVVLEEI